MPPTTPRPSPNFDARSRAVDLVVLHYTGMQNAAIALARLTDPAPLAGRYPGPWQDPAIDPATPLSRVSAHYVIDEAGEIFALVSEEMRAWHAGQSFWQGESDVNARSIGIELVNGGHDFGLPEFPDRQILALVGLLKDVLKRHRLGPHRVVGHADIAPGRKLDPGERFPWARLADFGVAIWPESPPPVSVGGGPLAYAQALAMQEALAAFGYGVPQSGVIDEATRAAVAAFQRRFRPEKIDGAPDEETAALLADVAAQSARLMLRRLQS